MREFDPFNQWKCGESLYGGACAVYAKQTNPTGIPGKHGRPSFVSISLLLFVQFLSGVLSRPYIRFARGHTESSVGGNLSGGNFSGSPSQCAAARRLLGRSSPRHRTRIRLTTLKKPTHLSDIRPQHDIIGYIGHVPAFPTKNRGNSVHPFFVFEIRKDF